VLRAMTIVCVDLDPHHEAKQARKAELETQCQQAMAKLRDELVPFAARAGMKLEDFTELFLMHHRDPEKTDELMRDLASNQGMRLLLRHNRRSK
jgi:hypothetical protein